MRPVEDRRWGARLDGPAGDLQELAEHLTGEIALRAGDEGWELTDERWEVLTDALDVHRAAERVAPRLTAIVRLRIGSGPPISYTNAIIERTPAGSRKHGMAKIAVTGRGRITLKAMIAAPDGALVFSPPESWQPDLDLAEHDADVDRALAFLAAPPTWTALYSAMDAVFGDRRIKVRSPAGKDKNGKAAVDARSWATLNELERFEGTAHSFSAVGAAARHGRGIPPPPDPMTLDEAHELVHRVVSSWMTWLCGGV